MKDLPKVWMSSWSADPRWYPDLAAHGVQGLDRGDIGKARELGLKTSIGAGRITPADVTRYGLAPEYAVAICGTYQNLSIDSHTFPFYPGRHSIEVFRPYHYAPYDATTKEYITSNRTFGDYFPESYFSTDMVRKAEVIVKQRDYDGEQHLTIIPASITETRKDSVIVSFELTGSEGDLQNTMVAVYWQAQELSPSSESTRRALALSVRETLERVARDNGGTFPGDVVRALRYGDEMFLMTSFAHSPKCSIPLYDYSESGIAAFRKLDPSEEYPRTWGFPEVYGVNAYRDWLYSFHTATAELVRTLSAEVHKVAPHVAVFRNPTRFNPTTFATLPNDHDGCSTQLLVEQFDMINADPYPVSRTGDSQHVNPDREKRPGYIESLIPLECAYFTGLTRRMGKLFVPWLQAHTFAQDLMHISSSDAYHIYQQVVKANPDGIMWLGYSPADTAESPFLGMTLPNLRPETWKTLGYINQRAQRELGRPEPKRSVAVLRFYAERALVDLQRRNLHDRLLTERLLTALTMDLDIPYDVYEFYQREDVDWEALKSYRHVLLCVLDIEGLPLDELRENGIPLSIVCFDPSSLEAHPAFTGVQELRRCDSKDTLTVKSRGGEIASNYAFAASPKTPDEGIAAADGGYCMWRHGKATFASFVPTDPFDDGKYLSWLLDLGEEKADSMRAGG